MRLTWTPGRLQGLTSASETPGRLFEGPAWPASWQSFFSVFFLIFALLMICCRGVEWLALKDESHAQVHTDGHVIGKNIDIN